MRGKRLMDIFDQATEREEQERERAIAAARKPVSVVPFHGFCHNCQAPLVPSDSLLRSGVLRGFLRSGAGRRQCGEAGS